MLPRPDERTAVTGDAPPASEARASSVPRDGLEEAFAAALTDPSRPRPTGVVGPDGKAADRRFAVYRNNVVTSLVNVLADIFPAVQRIVGERFFRAMARVHVLQSPPTSRLMTEYGREFPAFVSTFEPAREMPYLADVARIERAWLDAYHAADAAPLDPQALAAIAPEALAAQRFVPHPAARVLRSPHAANTVFAMNRSGGEVRPVDLARPEDTLVVRPQLDVNAIGLPSGGSAFLIALMEGRTLGEAAGAGAQDADRVGEGFDLPANIAGMLEAGVFTSLRGEA